MSEIKGLLRTCDRCGTQIFLKCVGEGEADGGFTRWNKFEDAPTEWKFVNDVGTVCPKCWEDYVWMLDKYKIRPPKEKRD